jgi:hypothetical protein
MQDIDYLLMKIPARLKEYSKAGWTIVSLALVAFLGFTDYVTGEELAFSIFYLVPISIACLLARPLVGVLVSFVSAATWLWADLAAGHVYSRWLIPYWNAATRLGYFLLHTLMLGLLLAFIRGARDLALKDALTGAANWRDRKSVV